MDREAKIIVEKLANLPFWLLGISRMGKEGELIYRKLANLLLQGK